MTQNIRFSFLTLFFFATTAFAEPPPPSWPSFRGPAARGIADGRPPPTAWDVDKGVNIRWKTPLPGLGYSSPVIWGDRLFITTAVRNEGESRVKVGLYGDITPLDEPVEHSWRVICLDRSNGKLLWQQDAHKGVPKVKRHPKSSHANSTPATDGNRVVAFFGSEGLYCYDMHGKLIWKKDFGLLDSGYYVAPDAQWGFGSSPIIHDGKVIVQCDVQQNSFVAAFDAADGREIWRTPRDEVPTWSTPTVHVESGRAQVICNGFKRIAGYDLATGRELWKLRGGGDIPVPTPVVADGLIYITNAHGMMAPIYAIRTTAAGTLSVAEGRKGREHVAWWSDRRGNYMQTPLAVDGLLYCCMDNGVLTVLDAKSGDQKYRERLAAGTGFTASGVAAAGRLYFTSETGDVFVLKAGPGYELLNRNTLGEVCMATPAIVDGMLYFRTQGHVIAIGEQGRRD